MQDFPNADKISRCESVAAQEEEVRTRKLRDSREVIRESFAHGRGDYSAFQVQDPRQGIG